jgi:putative membrane protein insertion efficiency factor
MKLILITPIKIYQKWISPMFAPRCKYYPSCSSYAVTAIENYGVKGVAMAAWRLVRCNPWSHGGVDYVLVNKKRKENRNSKNEKKEKVTVNG